jgi:hypothetical protein
MVITPGVDPCGGVIMMMGRISSGVAVKVGTGVRVGTGVERWATRAGVLSAAETTLADGSASLEQAAISQIDASRINGSQLPAHRRNRRFALRNQKSEVFKIPVQSSKPQG